MTSLESNPPKIAVLVDSSTSWGRNVIGGIHSYQGMHRHWHIYVQPKGLEQKLSLPAGWNGQGVIARIGYHELSKQLKQSKLPVVNISGIRIPGANFPRITGDLRKSAHIAAEYFFNHGFRHFAYFSQIRIDYVSEHQLAFTDYVNQQGEACHLFEPIINENNDADVMVDSSKMRAWLSSLPKPVGILTWSSSAARELVYACVESGHKIPDHISILSGSDDELFCKVAPVPISAVRVSADEIGFLAAKRLDEMMSSPQAKKQEDIFVPPMGITVRQSTEILAVEDPALARALRYIREDPSRNINVDDVAARAGFCRRVLEQRFAKVLGRSPAAEIRRVRVEHAIHLLKSTNLRISDVAEKSGFSSPEYMASVFRSDVGSTPLSFRKNKPASS